MLKRKELKEQRTATSKHYLNPDGTISVEMYSRPIHYLNNYGIFEEIDNTLESTSKGFKNKKNSFIVEFDEANEDSFINISLNDKKIRMIPKGFNQKKSNKKNEKINSKRIKEKIKYEKIIDDNDIEYELSGQKLKETIIINKKPKTNKISFLIDTNLKLLKNKDNSIDVFDEQKRIFKIERPYMFDSNNLYSTKIKYELSKDKDKYSLDIIIDQDWLEIANYPIFVDPTISTAQDTTSVIDTTLYSNDSYTHGATDHYLRVGYLASDVTARALLKFELPKIPTGKKIVDASLVLSSHPNIGELAPNINRKVLVHAINKEWDEETATWANMGNSYDSHIYDYFIGYNSVAGSEENTISLNYANVTELVEKWYNNKMPNYGILLKWDIESECEEGNSLSLLSKDGYDYTQDEELIPAIIMTYREFNGLEENLSYTSQTHRFGESHINTYTGNLTTTFNLGGLNGGNLPISLSLIYNSSDAIELKDYGYGVGVKPNLLQIIKELDSETISYLDEDGTVFYFSKQEDGSFVDELGTGLSITKIDENYIMTDCEGSSNKFIKHANEYFLEEITDSIDKKITIQFNENNKITKITDSYNQSINISYETGKIIVSSPDIESEVTLNNNLIINVSYMGDVENISYTSNNLIEKLINPDNTAIKYEYNNEISPKIIKVSEISKLGNIGNYLTFEYSHEDTKIIDNKGRFNTYNFDSNGNVIGITCIDEEMNLKDAYAKVYSFGESGEKNQLSTDKALIKYINNLIKNSSFEEDTEEFEVTSGIYKEYTTDSRSGIRALKLTNNQLNEYLYKDISLAKEKNYNFSLYIKNTIPVQIKLLYDDVEEKIEVTELHNSYERYDLSIYYSLDATEDIRIQIEPLAIGEIIIDDVQLEEGTVANYYNLVTNSSFEDGTNTWNINISPANEESIAGDANVSIENINENNKALKIHSNPLDCVYITKTFNISGKQGDTFNLSFWYKNEGILPSGYIGLNQGIFVNVFFNYGDEYLDGTGITPEILKVGSDNWQYLSKNFVAEADYENVFIQIMSLENANNTYLTNFTLFKDLEQYSYQYDDNGNLVSTINLNKQKNEMLYDSNNQLTKMINTMGSNYTFEYDNIIPTRMIRAISPSGINNYIKYDNNGNPIKVLVNNKKSLDNISNERKYHLRGKGTNKYFFINSDKSVRMKEDERSYDSFYIELLDENIIKIKHAILTNYYIKESNNNIILSYGDSGNEFKLSYNDNATYSIIKEENNNSDVESSSQKAISIGESGKLIMEEYNSESYNQQFIFEPFESKQFIEIKAEYDTEGKYINKTIDSLGNEVLYEIDNTTGKLKSVIDSLGQVMRYSYNSKQQLVSTNKGDRTISYEYENGNLSKLINGQNNYIYTYDEFNNLTNIKINNNMLVEYIVANQNGNLLERKYGNNQSLSYAYDNKDRIQKITKQDDTYTNYYDNLGRVAKYTSNTDLYKFNYDFANRISKYKYNQFEAEYDYNENNKIIKKVHKLNNQKHNITFNHNLESLLNNVVIENDYFNYEYDELGRVTSTSINENNIIKYKYLSLGNKTSLLIAEVNDNGNVYNYYYDKIGNIVEIRKNNATINNYYYDQYSQLIREENLLKNMIITYDYDLNGNLLYKKKYTYDTNNLLENEEYTYADSNWKDLLTSKNTENVTYDSIGNMLTLGNASFTWKNGIELASYNDGTNNVTYKYNVDGIRISKIVNNQLTKYYLENEKIIFEDRAGNVIYYIYNNSQVLGFKYNGNTYYYHKNIFGDVIGIFNSSFEEIVTYEYDSWGNIINIKDNSNINLGVINPFRYRSYYYDEETKLYYVNQRYYNSSICRFINSDEIDLISETTLTINDKNLFTYCDNNPITRYDKSGYFWESAFDVISLGASIVEVAVNPTDPWAWASLAGDTIDLIPFATGVGETVKAVKVAKKTKKTIKKAKTVKKVQKKVEAGTDVIKAAKALKRSDDLKDINTTIGSYELIFKSNTPYNGKGGFPRAIDSAKRITKETGDEVVAIRWKSAPTEFDSFIDEFIMQAKNGGVKSYNKDANTFNKIWSPGRNKYFNK